MKKIMLKAFITTMFITSIVSCSSAQNKTPNDQPNGGPPTVDELFVQMDSNKDGKLSKTEVKGPLTNDFSKIDSNKDGFITKEELEKAPKPNRQRPPQGQSGQQGPPSGGN